MRDIVDDKTLNIFLNIINVLPKDSLERKLSIVVCVVSARVLNIKLEKISYDNEYIKFLFQEFCDSFKNYKKIYQNYIDEISYINDVMQNIDNKLHNLHTSLHSLHNNIFCFFLPEFFYLLKHEHKNLALIKNAFSERDVIVLLGETGCGKSTTALYLSGINLQKKEIHLPNNSGLIITIEPAENLSLDKELTKIRPSYKARSETSKIITVPISFSTENNNSHDELLICDTPGIGDTRSNEMDVIGSYHVVEFIKTCQRLRPVIILSKDGFGERLSGLKSIIHTLSHMITTSLDDLSGFKFVFSKFQRNSDENYIKGLLNELKNSLNIQEISNNAFMKIVNHLVNMQEIVIVNPLSQNHHDLLAYIMQGQAVSNSASYFSSYLSKQSETILQNQLMFLADCIGDELRIKNYSLIEMHLQHMFELKKVLCKFNFINVEYQKILNVIYSHAELLFKECSEGIKKTLHEPNFIYKEEHSYNFLETKLQLKNLLCMLAKNNLSLEEINILILEKQLLNYAKAIYKPIHELRNTKELFKKSIFHKINRLEFLLKLEYENQNIHKEIQELYQLAIKKVNSSALFFWQQIELSSTIQNKFYQMIEDVNSAWYTYVNIDINLWQKYIDTTSIVENISTIKINVYNSIYIEIKKFYDFSLSHKIIDVINGLQDKDIFIKYLNVICEQSLPLIKIMHRTNIITLDQRDACEKLVYEASIFYQKYLNSSIQMLLNSSQMPFVRIEPFYLLSKEIQSLFFWHVNRDIVIINVLQETNNLIADAVLNSCNDIVILLKETEVNFFKVTKLVKYLFNYSLLTNNFSDYLNYIKHDELLPLFDEYLQQISITIDDMLINIEITESSYIEISTIFKKLHAIKDIVNIFDDLQKKYQRLIENLLNKVTKNINSYAQYFKIDYLNEDTWSNLSITEDHLIYKYDALLKYLEYMEKLHVLHKESSLNFSKLSMFLEQYANEYVADIENAMHEKYAVLEKYINNIEKNELTSTDLKSCSEYLVNSFNMINLWHVRNCRFYAKFSQDIFGLYEKKFSRYAFTLEVILNNALNAYNLKSLNKLIKFALLMTQFDFIEPLNLDMQKGFRRLYLEYQNKTSVILKDITKSIKNSCVNNNYLQIGFFLDLSQIGSVSNFSYDKRIIFNELIFHIKKSLQELEKAIILLNCKNLNEEWLFKLCDIITIKMNSIVEAYQYLSNSNITELEKFFEEVKNKTISLWNVLQNNVSKSLELSQNYQEFTAQNSEQAEILEKAKMLLKNDNLIYNLTTCFVKQNTEPPESQYAEAEKHDNDFLVDDEEKTPFKNHLNITRDNNVDCDDADFNNLQVCRIC